MHECAQKQNFCNMCCGYHIGTHLPHDFQACSMQCESIILGDIKPKVKGKSDIKGSKNKNKGAMSARKGKRASRKSSKSKKKTSTTKQMKKFFKNV